MERSAIFRFRSSLNNPESSVILCSHHLHCKNGYNSSGIHVHPWKNMHLHLKVYSRPGLLIFFVSLMTSIPKILALPLVGKIIFIIIRIVVDLPAPLGPINPKISPSPISRFTCSIPLSFP